MSIEAWSILISAVIAVVVPLALWLISTHGKLSRIDERTSTMIEQAQEHRREHDELDDRINNHETRIIVLEHK